MADSSTIYIFFNYFFDTLTFSYYNTILFTWYYLINILKKEISGQYKNHIIL